MSKLFVAHEYCSHCQSEEKVYDIIQPCPNCGEQLVACSMCIHSSTGNCGGCVSASLFTLDKGTFSKIKKRLNTLALKQILNKTATENTFIVEKDIEINYASVEDVILDTVYCFDGSAVGFELDENGTYSVMNLSYPKISDLTNEQIKDIREYRGLEKDAEIHYGDVMMLFGKVSVLLG